MANSSIKLTDIPLASNISINSKLLAVDFETEKTELITTKDLIVYLSNTVTYRDQVNTTYELANSAFVAANAAYIQSLEVFDLSNTAYILANASYDIANTVYEIANSAFIQANNAYTMSNSAYDLANTSEIIVFTNYNSVNAMYEMTNSIALQVNSHYELSNTIVIQSELSVNTANYALSVANVTFDLVNSISFVANSSYEISNAALLNSNNTLLYSYYAFDVANSAYDQANVAFNLANSVSEQSATILDAANNAYIHANDAYNTANSKLSLSGGTITGNLSILGAVTIENNLTVAGNVTSISANNLILQDNMIYLNNGAANNANPDLGIVGAYNDGVFRHTGIFRDATDGYWKIFDQYEPDPDASIYIDTSNNTFRLANFQANNLLGNIDASNLTSGIIVADRLGSGIANANTYLAGDNSWKSIISGATLSVDESSNSLFYIGLSNSTSGSWIEAFVAPNQFVYNTGLNRLGLGTSDPKTVLHISSNDAIIIPSGTIGERPTEAINGMIRYNTSNNYIESYSNNSWSQVGSGASGVPVLRQTFTATANQTSFSVTGGYVSSQLDVYYNGSKLVNGVDVDVSSGSTVELTTGADDGTIIDIVGIGNEVTFYDTVRLTGDTMTGALIAPSFTGDGANLTSISVSNINASGNANSSTYLSGDSSWKQIDLSNINANNITSGTVNSARLGSGTANSTTYLAGDNSWKSIQSGATLTNDVSSNTIYYIGMSSGISGSWTSAIVSNTKLYFNSNTGTLSATIFNSLSDRSLKENIKPIDSGSYIIDLINPVSFNWKDSGKKSYGVIAQELENVIPDIVTETNGLKSVEYDALIPFLIKSNQELKLEINILNSKLEEIISKIGIV
nr:MAG: hypothetical protein [Caudoviricetes sp.]